MKLFKPISLTGMTIFCLLLHWSVSAKGQTRRVPAWEKVALVPFTIVPRAMEGAPARLDQNDIMQRLGSEATVRAERLLLKRGVAATVERVASAQASAAPALVTGTVTLPISLPRGVIGWRALSRKGPFATAKVLLMDASGKVLAQQEVTLDWGDVRWLWGGRARHNIPLDEVLMKFTRKAVDRAVEQLARGDLGSSAR